MLKLLSIGIVLAVLAALNSASAQTQNIKRTPLQKFDVPNSNSETVIGIAEVVPNVNIGRHTHPGPEPGYLLEGELVLIVEGQPDKIVKTGESYQVPAGSIHDAKTGYFDIVFPVPTLARNSCGSNNSSCCLLGMLCSDDRW